MKYYDVEVHCTTVYQVRVQAENKADARRQVDRVQVNTLGLTLDAYSETVMAVTDSETRETVLEEDIEDGDDAPVSIAGYRDAEGVAFCGSCFTSNQPIPSGSYFSCYECERICQVP